MWRVRRCCSRDPKVGSPLCSLHLLNFSARQRLERIRREDALEMIDRTVVLESFSRRQNVFISKRHGLWEWDRDGIPGWLLPVLRDAGLLD